MSTSNVLPKINSSNLSNDDIISWVKGRLGYPVVMVELTDEMIESCIDDALHEISPWIVQSKYITVPTQQCIDLSEYNVSYVIRVHKGQSANSSISSSTSDVFNSELVRSSMMMSTRSSSSIDLFSNMNTIRSEIMLIDKTISSTKDNISFRYIKPYLYLDIGYPSSSMCTIQYVEYIKNISDITDPYYLRMLKKFTLAYARLMIYEIRGKYTVNNSPTSLNADTELSQANNELEELREELKSSVVTDFIID